MLPRACAAAVQRLIVLGVLLLSSNALAQVSCANPDNLCPPGDPCVIQGPLEVQSPCTVDFRPRALVTKRLLLVPNGGVLEFTAGAIDVQGPIIGKHDSGAHVTLISDGNIELTGRINTTGKLSPGSITLDAAGDIQLRGGLRSGGSNATGGTATVDANGTLTSRGSGQVRVNSRRTAQAGVATLQGTAGVNLSGRVYARGGSGGEINVSSMLGNVTINRRLDVEGKEGAGGHITLCGGTLDTVNRVCTQAPDGTVEVNDKLRASGDVEGGTIAVSGGTVRINNYLRAKGGYNGGIVRLCAMGTVAGEGPRVYAGSGPTDIGGCVHVGGSTVEFAGARFRVKGKVQGGEMRFEATAGNLTLDGDFDARSGGVVQAKAPPDGTLTAFDRFRTEPAGCIGLVAGTVDAWGTFEPNWQPEECAPVICPPLSCP